MSEAEALAFIQDMAMADLLSPGAWGQLAIARAADGALVGDLGLFVSASGEYAELGVTISPEAQGRGYASAAVVVALRLLFEQTGVERVIGITDARNGPSVSLLERVGMSRVESREAIFKGEPCVEWVYAKARSGASSAGLEP